MKKTAVVYCFTGTGNALMAANFAVKELSSQNFSVHLQMIQAGSEKINGAHDKADVIGFVSSIYGFGLPQLMAKFMRNLPEGNGKKVFFFAVTGENRTIKAGKYHFVLPSTEGAGILQARVRLFQKKYNLLQADKFVMPDNWILAINPSAQQDCFNMYRQTEEGISKRIKEFVIEKKYIRMMNPAGMIFLGIIYFFFVFFGRRVLGKTFTLNEKCNSCGICRDECPSKTINWYNERPYWGFSCQQCFRCINICPKAAIEISTFNLIVLAATLFFGDVIFGLMFGVNDEKLPLLDNSSKIVFTIALNFLAVWFVHMLEFRSIIPKWYITQKRDRYKNPDLKVKS